MLPFLRRTLVFVAMLLPAPVLAADWTYENGQTPIAYVDAGTAQLQFACRGGDLAMGFWVRQPSRAVAAAASMSVALTPDPPGGTTIFAQDMPLIHSDGSSVIVRGPVARQWAMLAQRARKELRVAYARPGTNGSVGYLDAATFSAAGSAAAIRQVLAQCG